MNGHVRDVARELVDLGGGDAIFMHAICAMSLEEFTDLLILFSRVIAGGGCRRSGVPPITL
jgi:hypothetical protein